MFKTVTSKLEATSKRPYAGKLISKWLPFKQPSVVVQGDAKSTFLDLEMVAGVAIDPTFDSDCLTSLFCRSEQMINKIDVTTSQGKRLTLVLSICALFPNLMLGMNDNLL